MEVFNRETQLEIKRIIDTDMPEMEKFIRLFDWVTTRFSMIAEREIELARAMGDQTNVIKHQIKLSTVQLCRGMFESCYLQATGERKMLWSKEAS